MPKHYYEVIVQNIGKVWEGHDILSATLNFTTYVRMSKSDIGRASNEVVTLFKDGLVIREYFPPEIPE